MSLFFVSFAILASSFIEAKVSVMGERWAALNKAQKIQVIADWEKAQEVDPVWAYDALAKLTIFSSAAEFDRAVERLAKTTIGEGAAEPEMSSNFARKIASAVQDAEGNSVAEVEAAFSQSKESDAVMVDPAILQGGEGLDDRTEVKRMAQSLTPEDLKAAEESNKHQGLPATQPSSDMVKPVQNEKPLSDIEGVAEGKESPSDAEEPLSDGGEASEEDSPRGFEGVVEGKKPPGDVEEPLNDGGEASEEDPLRGFEEVAEEEQPPSDITSVAEDEELSRH